jgi:hypothetical protein
VRARRTVHARSDDLAQEAGAAATTAPPDTLLISSLAITLAFYSCPGGRARYERVCAQILRRSGRRSKPTTRLPGYTAGWPLTEAGSAGEALLRASKPRLAPSR